MPSLIGNKPNQVPSNGDLGTLAFQDASNPKVGAVVADSLVVDTNTLVVDSVNDRVGVGTASPENRLDIQGTVSASPVTNGIVRIVTTGSNPATGSGGGLLFAQQNSGGAFSNYASITSSRVNQSANNKVDLVFSTGAPSDAIAIAERMRIDTSGNVGIGITPAYKVDVSGGNVSNFITANIYNSFATSTTAFNNRLLRIASQGNGADASIQFTDSVANNAGIGMNAGNLLFSAGGFTERMRINSAGQVGIGTTSPTRKLHVVQNATISTSSFDTSTFSQFLGTSGVSASTSLGFQATTADGSQGYAAITCVPTSNYRSGLIATYTGDAFGTGYFAINRYAATGSTSEVLRADSIGNVGIGTSSPTEKLQVNGVIKSTSDGNLTSGAAAHLYYTSGTSSAELVALNPGVGWLNQTYKALSHQFSISGTERMRIDASGNLGLGVTPNATWTGSHRVFQFGSTSSIYSLGGSTAVNENSYNDGTNRYLTTNFATRYLQATGQHIWFNAPSGTAGNAITFTQAMTLDASGNLQLGTTTAVTSNGTNLNIYGASASNLSLQNATSGTGNNNGFQLIQDGLDTYLQNRENGAAIFATNNAERMRIDSSGRLLIGTTSANGIVTVAGSSQMSHTYSGAVGRLDFGQYNSSGDASINNTSNANLLFATNNAERMRIDSSGNLLVGTTTAGGRFNVSGITNTTSTSGIASSNNAGLKSLTGVAASTLTTVATLTKPAGNSSIRRTVFTVTATNDGADSGYTLASSTREVLFSNYGGTTTIIKSTELSNNQGSINSGVINITLTTAAALSGTSVLLQATATITGSSSAGLAAILTTKVEVISSNNYQDITFA